MASYSASLISPLSPYSYQVEALIEGYPHPLKRVPTVFDTGAGPNLIQRNVSPGDTSEPVDVNRPVIDLSSALNHRIPIVGVLYLIVKIKGYTAREKVIVTKELGADAILGTNCNERHVDTTLLGRHL